MDRQTDRQTDTHTDILVTGGETRFRSFHLLNSIVTNRRVGYWCHKLQSPWRHVLRVTSHH